MQIRDLGEEAIREILAEALDGMNCRTGQVWKLNLDGEHGDLSMTCNGGHVTTANVQPHLGSPRHSERAPGGKLPPEAIRFRSALRRLILDATQAVSPVPGAANVPGALGRAFEAIRTLDAASTREDLSMLPAVRHDLYRILDELTGCDHSGCTSKPSVADYDRVGEVTGRVVFNEKGDLLPRPKSVFARETTTHEDGSTRVRTGRA